MGRREFIKENDMGKVLVDQDFLEDGLELICDKIRLKTGGTGLLAFPVEIASAVESIETGSGGITPTGTKTITENGEGIDVTTYAAVDVAVPSSGADTSDATAAAADIAADKTAYIATGKTSGSATVRTGSDLVASGETVMVPAGIYRASVSKSVTTATQATPSVSVNGSGLVTATASQSAGYVAAGTKSGTLQLSAKGAETFIPGTTDQEIPAGKYTTGKQTIKGDSKLVPGNIKSGVQIFGVTGTYGGAGGTPALIPKTGSSVTVNRTSTKVLAISGLDVEAGETLVGLVLRHVGEPSSTNGYINDMVLLNRYLSNGSLWYGYITGPILNAVQFSVSSLFTVTKYNGETAVQLNIDDNVSSFELSYDVYPIVAKVVS